MHFSKSDLKKKRVKAPDVSEQDGGSGKSQSLLQSSQDVAQELPLFLWTQVLATQTLLPGHKARCTGPCVSSLPYALATPNQCQAQTVSFLLCCLGGEAQRGLGGGHVVTLSHRTCASCGVDHPVWLTVHMGSRDPWATSRHMPSICTFGLII